MRQRLNNENRLSASLFQGGALLRTLVLTCTLLWAQAQAESCHQNGNWYNCQYYGLTQNSQQTDRTYISSQSTLTIDSDISFNVYCCLGTAKLWQYNNSTNTWDEYTNPAAQHPLITSFTSSGNYNTPGTLQLYSTDLGAAYKPSVTFKFRIRVFVAANTGYYLDNEFDVVYIDECVNNVLSAYNPPEDVMYNILAAGGTLANEQNIRVERTVTESRCPSTQTLAIWDEPSGGYIDYVDGALGGIAWADTSSSTWQRITLTVQTDDLSYQGQSYYFRYRSEDPLSEDPSNPFDFTFTVSYTYECDSDYFSLSGVSEQTYELGEATKTIALGMTHNKAACAYTVEHYYWNNSTAAWTALTSSLNWIQATPADNDIKIYIAPASYNSFRPELFHDIKVVYTSTYSEHANAIQEERFKVWIRDPCIDNAITLTTNEQDYFFSTEMSQKALVPSVSSTHSLSQCPLTISCSYWDEASEIWSADCSSGDPAQWYVSFNSGTGQLDVNYNTASFLSHYSDPWPDVETRYRITYEDPYSLSDTSKVEDFFTLTMSYQCLEDSLSLTTNIGQKHLIIGGGSVTAGIDDADTISSCPKTYILEFLNENTQAWEAYTSESFVSSFNSNTGEVVLQASDSDYATYDQMPWYNITAKITVTSVGSNQPSKTAEDIFVISIAEKCRMVDPNAAINAQLSSTGTAANPYTVEMWDRLDIPLTAATYTHLGSSIDPNTITRCTVTTTLHYSNGDRTAVTASKYLFNSQTAPTQLSLQWDTDVFQDYFVIQTAVTYTGTNEVLILSEGFVYVTISNPCLIASGGAFVAQTIASIAYWIKDAQFNRDVPYVQDHPTVSYGGQTYLYANGNNLCGAKTYEIVMADQVTANTNTAYLNLVDTSSLMQLQVQTNDPVYYTNAEVVYYLKVTLDDYLYRYPDEATTYISFRLDMMNCQVGGFNKDSDQAYTYILRTPVHKYTYSAFTTQAADAYIKPGYTACDDYVIQYSVLWRTYYDTTITLPIFIEWKEATREFWIQSDDEIDISSLRQTYTIELTGTILATDMSPVYQDKYTFTLNVVHTCPTDVLTLVTGASNTFTDYIYYIHENTVNGVFAYGGTTTQTKQFVANWSTSIPYCPIDFEIVQDDDGDGTYEAITAAQQAVLSLTSPMVITRPTHTWEEQFDHYQYDYPDPQITLNIFAEDIATYDGEVWTLAVNRVSTESLVAIENAQRATFTLELRDICWDIPLTATAFSTTPKITVDLWSIFSIDHTQAHRIQAGWPSDQTYCGSGFTHSVLYDLNVSGSIPEESVADMDTLFPLTTGATFSNLLLKELDWVGSHQIKIRSTVGTAGDKLYETNYIDTGSNTLEVVNPCETTSFTIPTMSQSPTRYQIVAREHGGEVIWQYEEPTDSASTAYGGNLTPTVDAYSLCGPRTHYLTLGDTVLGLQRSTQRLRATRWLEFEYLPNGDPYDPFPSPNPVPVYQIRVNSTSQEDWGEHVLKLHFTLDDYPDSTANDEEWELNAQIEYCLVEDWKAPSDFWTAFTIGSKLQTLTYVFWQYPCTYEATYSGRIVEINGEAQSDTSVPDFIEVDSRSGTTSIYSNNEDDLGWYVLEVTASLDVIDLLGDLNPRNDPDNDFLNEFLYDSAGNKIYAAENPPSDFIYQSSFNITIGIIKVNETSVTDENTPPYMMPRPPYEFKVVAGEDWSYDFGRIYDFEDDNVTLSVDLRNAEQFFTFDQKRMRLSVPWGKTDLQTQPVFDIRMTLADNHEQDPLKTVYDMKLVIVKDLKDPILELLLESRKTQVINTYQGRVYDLTNTTVDEVREGSEIDYYSPQTTIALQGLKQSSSNTTAEEQDTREPNPTIESVTSDGLATLRFATPMKVPEVDDLVESRVALRLTRAISTDPVSYEQYLTDEGVGSFEIRDAIEVRMVPSSLNDQPIEIDFVWEIVKFSEYEVQIQLYFQLPEAVSAGNGSDPDEFEITFWASDLFEGQNGLAVKPGLTIRSPIVRQLNKENYDYYSFIGRTAGYATLGVLVVGFLFAVHVNADTFPIWVCYDTLVLITHIPMVNLNFAGSMSVCMVEFAKVMRLQFLPAADIFESWSDQVGQVGQPLSPLMKQNGYETSSVLLNVSPFFVIFAVLILAQLVASILDLSYVKMADTKKAIPNGRTEVRKLTAGQMTLNMIFRALMCTMFELFVCVLINFKAAQNQSSSAQTDFESVSRIICYFLLLILGLFIFMLFVLAVMDSDPGRVEKDAETGRRKATTQPLPQILTLYLNVKNERRAAANLLLIAFSLRRAVHAVVFVLLSDYPLEQLLLLLLSSMIYCITLAKSKPYSNALSKWLSFSFELIFAWCIAFSLVFSPGFLAESYSIATQVGAYICLLGFTVPAITFLAMIYSIGWQISFNSDLRNNLLKPKVRKVAVPSIENASEQKLAPIAEEQEEQEESYRDIRLRQRERQKQRKIDVIANLQQDQTALAGGAQQEVDLFAEDNELNQLAALAGLTPNKNDQLEISDDDEAGNERPNSVGAESSYSDFMQKWKSKLYENSDDANGPPNDDVVSSHSRRSNLSKAASDSPFLNITQEQTKKLLKGEPAANGVIPEAQYEDSEDSDGDNDPNKAGIILSKTDRRRLNMLSDRRQNPKLSVIAEAPELGSKVSGSRLMNGGTFGASNLALAGQKPSGDTIRPLGGNIGGIVEQENDEFELL